VQRVEEEMGVELHFERMQLRLHELSFEMRRSKFQASRLQLLFAEAPAILERIARAHNRPVKNHVYRQPPDQTLMEIL